MPQDSTFSPGSLEQADSSAPPWSFLLQIMSVTIRLSGSANTTFTKKDSHGLSTSASENISACLVTGETEPPTTPQKEEIT